MVKWLGCCTLCDKEVFEAKTRFVEAFVGPGSVFIGRLKEVHRDRPLADARRLTFILSDGTEADVTFCKECATGVFGKFDEIWARCLEAFRFENDHRAEFRSDDSPALIKRATAFIESLKTIRIEYILRNVSWQSLG